MPKAELAQPTAEVQRQGIEKTYQAQHMMGEFVDTKSPDPLCLRSDNVVLTAFDSHNARFYFVDFPERYLSGLDLVAFLRQAKPYQDPPNRDKKYRNATEREQTLLQRRNAITGDWDVVRKMHDSFNPEYYKGLVDKHRASSFGREWQELITYDLDPFLDAVNAPSMDQIKERIEYEKDNTQTRKHVEHMVRYRHAWSFFEIGEPAETPLVMYRFKDLSPEMQKRELEEALEPNWIRTDVDLNSSPARLSEDTFEEKPDFIDYLGNGLIRITVGDSYAILANGRTGFNKEVETHIVPPNEALRPKLAWATIKKTGQRIYLSSHPYRKLVPQSDRRDNTLLGLVAIPYLDSKIKRQIPGIYKGRPMQEAQAPLIDLIFKDKTIVKSHILDNIEEKAA